MRSRLQKWAWLAALPILVTGCAATQASVQPVADRSKSSGMSMSPGMSMSSDTQQGAPSEAARMICSGEVRHNVQQTLGLDTLPAGKATWVHGRYTCTYRLEAGKLALSVQDSPDLASGDRYFEKSRQQAGPTQPLRGLLGLGLPSYKTHSGTVAFLKDGKSLLVDASGLPREYGPDHQSRFDLAYAIAADVVACWSE